VAGRHGRRGKELLNYLKEKRRYWKLKEEAPDLIMLRTAFGRGYGFIVSLQNELINECMYE